jgi:hypothetical protein
MLTEVPKTVIAAGAKEPKRIPTVRFNYSVSGGASAVDSRFIGSPDERSCRTLSRVKDFTY